MNQPIHPNQSTRPPCPVWHTGRDRRRPLPLPGLHRRRPPPRLRPVSPVRTDGFTVYVANLRSYAKTAQIETNSERRTVLRR